LANLPGHNTQAGMTVGSIMRIFSIRSCATRDANALYPRGKDGSV
jgi:hypothetical protein